MERNWLLRHWRYLSYVVRHKWFVFIECCRLGIPTRGLLHDLSKFLPSEWFPYVYHFYGRRPTSKEEEDPRFDMAWLLHQRRNRHHWQWWVLAYDDGGSRAMKMSRRDVLEMMADWRGANRAQGGNGCSDTVAWYAKNKGRMDLHPDTRYKVEEMVERMAAHGQ